ncbi:TetR/AcrR family transcriptional regulator [Microbacterium sp. Marseille-Q6965]|uniref:TetR/AcrR family transcriptional regulator n=1 Tax=Microbacterium sp. Marseille-Q6965 TaxID=2965072 RepID=UPI0021B7D179|nr:TetR family transcriptional regulator [Microbacterium sp. Marseille-Q6965]
MRDRVRHDRESILDVALSLLDAYGLPDLTMRRLAAELGVQPSALYWHVESKQALLAGLADRIVAEAAPAADVAGAARALRAALLSHRDGAEVVLSSAALSLGALGAHDALRAAFAREHRPDPELAARVLLPFVLGHASLVQQRIQAAEFGAVPAEPATVAEATAADFDAGVAAILAGLPT